MKPAVCALRRELSQCDDPWRESLGKNNEIVIGVRVINFNPPTISSGVEVLYYLAPELTAGLEMGLVVLPCGEKEFHQKFLEKCWKCTCATVVTVMLTIISKLHVSGIL